MFKSKTTLRIAAALVAFTLAGGAMAAKVNEYASYGAQVTGVETARKVVVDAKTKWVNVTNGETVTFEVGGEHFTYQFQTNSNVNSVALKAIAPANIAAPAVTVYVSQQPQS